MAENQVNLFTINDIWEETDKQIPLDCTKTYDPLHFWEDYGDKYFKGFKNMTDIQRNVPYILHKVTSLKVDNLLDVGCGFCRLEPFLIDAKAVKEITSVDFSSKQIESAESYLKDYPTKDKIKLVKDSAKHLPFKENEFDCVLSVECLQHMHLPSVRYALHEMRRVSRKFVVLVERFVYEGEHAQPHLWSHNYVKLAGECGLKVLESKLIGNGIIATILRK